ncbi:MAG: N-acyl homoserine lactonase family protein [Pseudomonadota bacterium]
MSDIWEVYALKYGDRNNRRREESFIFDDNHDAPHAIDYFIWVLKNGSQTILVDSGYDPIEGALRGRPVLRDPVNALEAVNLTAGNIDTLIVTHMHYDHAGCLDRFPNAVFHVQEAEMAYATGPCMCHATLQMPFSADHVMRMVKNIYSGRVMFHEGDAEIAPGVTVHLIGGHSRGLQAVRVKTARGHLMLASDAAHFYENVFDGKPFPIVVDLQNMLDGFSTLHRLASDRSMIIPGHDPLVRDYFPATGVADFVHRLDVAPVGFA